MFRLFNRVQRPDDRGSFYKLCLVLNLKFMRYAEGKFVIH